jgi:(2Fe-2S) ferredoxin
MHPVSLLPKLHFFVCTNRRAEGSLLGKGCGAAGDAVLEALRAEVASRGAFRDVWITQTMCLGLCPQRGTTVAVYPKQAIVTEVDAGDAGALFGAELARSEDVR